MPVFISYSTKDSKEYDTLAHVLKLEGLGPKGASPTGGAPLADQLREMIQHCDACVFLATRNSVESKWCLAELGAFWGVGKGVVIYIADCKLQPTALPPQFTGNVWTRTTMEVARAVKKLLRRSECNWKPTKIEGKRLFQHAGYYPINLESGTNRPSLNRQIFAEAIEHLLDDTNFDRLAAMDLVYLRENLLNHEPDAVLSTHKDQYEALILKYGLRRFIEDLPEERERIFRNYERIVRDVGQSLRGIYFEILLHDVRNPIRSIIAAENSESVSGRRVGDPSTRFVVHYVRNQGRQLMAAMEGDSKIAYFKQFSRTKKVKATTTPIFDECYGLVGILCLNVDVEAVESLTPEGQKEFFEKYTWNTGETPAFEREQWGLV